MKHTMLWRVALFVVATLLVAGLAPVHASTFLKLDVAALTEQSDTVVHARVTNVESAWNEQHTIIFTHVTLRVIRALKGESEDEIVVRVPGGTAEGFTIKMAGAPEFPGANGTVVAFIGEWDDGARKVIGYAQGLSEIVRDNQGRESLKGGSAHGLSIGQLEDQVRQAAGRGR